MFFQKIFFILFTLSAITNFLNAQKNHDETKLTEENAIVSVAKTYLGERYVWGGNGRRGYDCSSFTKQVFEQNGIEIPRNSWRQAKVGKKVSKRALKKGDLLFFTSKHHHKVNHVGIYLGHGKFIHASRFHHKIVISPLREYRRYFKWGRRLL